ncbi:MAG: BlaI/MecI/CopY family transcriptional regulator [Candidatus Brocadiia bacterium]
MASIRLGRVQHQIMNVLWKRKRATAREITEALAGCGAPVHSTVQTLLRKLEAKGAVGHEVNDRTFIFFPLVTETDAARFALRDVIGRVFNGSPSGMVAYLVKHEKLTRKELDEIKKVIEETNP